jgi:Fe-S-cluster containining protein
MAAPARQKEASQEPWFSSGLKFKCTGCGKCCTGTSKSVYVSQVDLERLACYLRMPVGRFVRKFTRTARGRRMLMSAPGGDCVFLTNKACSVYEARPTQCRTYPWWLDNIQDQESWEEAAKLCEGIDHPSASVVPAAEILEQCRLDLVNESKS